jgi:hypothetical protein
MELLVWTLRHIHQQLCQSWHGLLNSGGDGQQSVT